MKTFVYSKEYIADFGDHVFPIQKYKLIYKNCINNRILKKEDFIEPEPISDKEILLVHKEKYLKKLERLAKSPLGMLNGENPVNQSILRFAKLSCAGTLTAVKIALKNKVAMNISGGFHHAFPDHEEGFCYLNDIAVAIKNLQKEKKIKKAMVIDCDVHQGNGTAFIFKNDKNVFTFSIHQEDLYPIKQKSDCDVGIYSHEQVTDEKYLKALSVLQELIKKFKPELIIYVAGADPYGEDQISNFQLTKEGLIKRDRYILDLAKKFNIPIVVVLAGGYAVKTSNVVDIHVNTIKEIKTIFRI